MADRLVEKRGFASWGLKAFLVPYFVVVMAVGGLVGHSVGSLCVSTDVVAAAMDPRLRSWFVYGASAVGIMTGVLLGEMLWRIWMRLFRAAAAASAADRAVGAVGIALGVLLGSAICVPFAVAGRGSAQSVFGPLLVVGLLGLFGVLGLLFALSVREELVALLSRPARIALPEREEHDPEPESGLGARPKIMDTSVIIDGRIASVRETGFIEGPILVPAFVLAELQHIADSADSLRRRRGRRGLVMLNKMQKEFGDSVSILEDYGVDLPDTDEVDIRLVHLAKHLDGAVVTNDFNLSKVAQLHGVIVLSVNELASALKPVLVHGEELEVVIVKAGREPGQGVAYLEDGTMVVVEGAADRVGDEVVVRVTSTIQTVAGKMVFAALADGDGAT